MSATTSATTGRRYGLERVCRTWERSRSALYARRARVRRPERGDGPGRRGPTPALSGAQLLAAIRSDLVRSPFQGEGHRKVSRAAADPRRHPGLADAGVAGDARAGATLAASSRLQGEMKAHDGTIVTSAPDVMWGTDGVRVFTADDGWVWTFAAVDHWNAECVGWYVCKVGSRFAALEPVAQGLRREIRLGRGGRGPRAGATDGPTAASICRTTSSTSSATGASTPASASSKSRKPTGSSSAGIARSRSKHVYGRVFRNLADVRAAVAEFFERYNQCWRLEKLAYRTPSEAREEYELRHAA